MDARPFVLTDYKLAEAGQLRGPVPARCPRGDDGSPCQVGFHCTRDRLTGPCIPLTVARCHLHDLNFTVYPPGFVPYGRASVLPVDLEGRLVHAEGGYAKGGGLVGTYWTASADAAEDRRWPESGGSVGCRRTQGRWLGLTAALFGLDQPARPREQISNIVKVPTLKLHEVAATYVRGGWRSNGKAVLELLELSLSSTPSRMLLVAGHLAGLWGRPSWWDPGGQTLIVCSV